MERFELWRVEIALCFFKGPKISFELRRFSKVMESENNLQGTKNVVRFSSYGESTVYLVKSKNKNLQSAVESFSLNLLLCFSKNSRVPVGI